MNFTWFASAYDTDDVPVPHRGVRADDRRADPRGRRAAGVRRHDFGVMTLGYVVMRLAMVALWLRAAAAASRGTAVRAPLRDRDHACVQVGWVAASRRCPTTARLVGVLRARGARAARSRSGPSRPGARRGIRGHIAERYGLFTIIVLGESVLSATVGVQTAIDLDTPFGDLGLVIVGGLLTLFTMWWIYFDLPNEQLVEAGAGATSRSTSRGAFAWGYGHYFVFACRGRGGHGLVVAVDHVTAPLRAHRRRSPRSRSRSPCRCSCSRCGRCTAGYKRADGGCAATPCRSTVVLILASSFTSEPVLVTGLVMVGAGRGQRGEQRPTALGQPETALTTTKTPSPTATTRNIDAPRKREHEARRRRRPRARRRRRSERRGRTTRR